MCLSGRGSKCKRCRLDRCLAIGLKADKVLLDESQRTKFTGNHTRRGRGGRGVKYVFDRGLFLKNSPPYVVLWHFIKKRFISLIQDLKKER